LRDGTLIGNSHGAGGGALGDGASVAVGLGKREKAERVPLDVKEGDTILFGKYSGQDIKLDGQEYLIMREDEVLAVLDSK